MQDILKGFTQPDQVRVIHDRATAIQTALQQAGPEDIVVIAGKGHEKVQVIGDQQIPFSDQQVVRAVCAEEGL
jgi:UDP-N-acetylmuramoyl-L-alanyl-D-glutamate--2,6-diaminopimelate ligase